MLGIGEFAMHAGVSVRMLRHYDRLGLLVPAAVDPYSGYRRYEPGQLARLNRLVALKDLGFTLEQIGPVLDGNVDAAALSVMLTLRRAQLAGQIESDQRRLAQVEDRLRLIEKENTMSELTFMHQALPALTVAGYTETVTDHTQIGPTIGPMFERLAGAMVEAGFDPQAPTVAWYVEDTAEGHLTVGAGVPVTAASNAVEGTERHELPAVDQAVTVTHRGPMSTIQDTWQQLMQYCAAGGLAPTGPCREVYLATPMGDEDAWVTELQQPVA